MSMQGDVVARLLADGAVSAVVGTRIYLSQAPQGVALPYVTLRIVSGPRYAHNLETGGGNYADARVQIDAYTTSDGQRATLCEAIRQSLQGMAAEEIVAGGVWCLGAGFSGPSDVMMPPKRGEELAIFGGRCELQIVYEVAAVT